MELYIYNSFCEFSANINIMALNVVRQVLSYTNDIAAEKQSILYSMRFAQDKKAKHALIKRLKALEATEHVCWLNDRQFPTGHLNIVKDTLEAINCPIKLIDKRTIPVPRYTFRWKNQPHECRYYQKEMVDLGLVHHRGVFESAVGTGKSLILEYLIYHLGVNNLIVVPSSSLKEQLYRDLVLYFGINKVQQITTAKIKKGAVLKPIRLVTVQTLASLQKNGLLHLLVSDIDALYIDEIHHAGSASYTNLLPEIEHIYYRFGFTGTFLRNDSRTLDMWGFLSTKLYSYPAYKAIEDGYLTPMEVHIYKLAGIRKPKYQTEYKANYAAGNLVLLEKIKEVIETQCDNQQVLILVNLKDQSGKVIHEYLNAFGIVNTYISGDDSKEVINDTIVAFNEKTINVLIGSSVIGEGIDICSTDHLLMCQGGKSEIAIVQALGRLARLYKDKLIGHLHDFRFVGTKYMVKHLNMRKDIYVNNFSPTFTKEQ